MKRISAILIAVFLTVAAAAQTPATADFKSVADSISTLILERTGVRTAIRFKKILRRGNTLDFYFTPTIGDCPWRSEQDIEWLHSTLQELMPEKYRGLETGALFCDRISMESLLTPVPGNDGKPSAYRFTAKSPKSHQVVTGGEIWPKGLSGRNIVVWQSHGRYYNESQGRWMWQRAPLHRTIEDIYTQDYVLPFLIPMLERAGAYVMTPRERDTQKQEYIMDNDPSFEGAREGFLRRVGRYSEKGAWSDAGTGFADRKEAYRLFENPFHAGTARQTDCDRTVRREAIWTPDILERGEYAVYVSYVTLPQSTDRASYTVRHMGGESRFLVDQTMGGGCWIYLGTFEFDRGTSGCVILDNITPDGRGVVTADAVKIGGGMGKVARGPKDAPDSDLSTSGLPAYLEGALYWEQWAGADSTVIGKWDGDYTCDYASRGAWTEMMKNSRGVPVDLTLAVHTDAGTAPGDSIVGTLAIYTYRNDGSTGFSDGGSRIVCRTYADMVQTQVCEDIRALFEPEWQRREMWDKGYSESRSSDTPALLLEMLSHQNFADMRLGQDPGFQFTVCRAIYKGMLKYLSTLYGVQYAVQPLPVSGFAVGLSREKNAAVLSWEDTPDPLEPTAVATGYKLYTRIDDGAFDTGSILRRVSTSPDGRRSVQVKMEPGHLYSFRLEAVGEGGRSFPSEVLCAGIAAGKESGKTDGAESAGSGSADPAATFRPAGLLVELASTAGRTSGAALIVNNFDRVAAPSWIDTPAFAGFWSESDAGMPWGETLGYAGEPYELRRDAIWSDDADPGFGASHTDRIGLPCHGNTFDLVGIHARAFLDAGRDVCSASRDAFVSGGLQRPAEGSGFPVIDLLCGAQVTTAIGRGAVPARYQVFPAPLRQTLRDAAQEGSDLIVSGAYIATDFCDYIYPAAPLDSAYAADASAFAKEVLGYKRLSGRGSALFASSEDGLYPVPHPDSIVPAAKGASTFMKYPDTSLPAAVFYDAGEYRVWSFGFPLEKFYKQ